MKRQVSRSNTRRRGMIVVLAAIMLIVLLGFIAFAVDIGYIGMVRTQLQSAADSAALAAAGSSGESQNQMVQVAQEFANANVAAGRNIQLNASDVELGSWDAATGAFTPMPAGQLGTAVRVTVRTSADSGGETALFFGRLLGLSSRAQEASAVATVNPRDIAFVVDLSGSMNDDTDPGSSSANSSLIQKVYDDFGFGEYPGLSQRAGQPYASSINSLKNWLRNNYSVDSRYRVGRHDSNNTKTWKAYAWVMEQQLGNDLMPAATPPPNADVNYNYWKEYIDANQYDLGYESYVEFMMDKGRDGQAGGLYTPLSTNSPYCPMHTETVDGEAFSFPPSEMPTHACRRALIAAIQVVRDRNQSISNVDQKDWVSVITFDSVNAEAVKWSLSHKDDYAGAMDQCRLLQANGWTATEAGLDMAYNHIKPQSEGGYGRERTNKIIVLLTDGMPNQKRSSLSSSTINDYIDSHVSDWTNPSTDQTIDNWVTSGSYAVEKNAALMHTSQMQGDNWNVYAAGVGGGCDYDFMDRVARMGMTANNDGESPRGTADPTAYEDVLKDIFEKIITNPKLRLVQ